MRKEKENIRGYLEKCEMCGEEMPENYCMNCEIYICNDCFDKLNGGDNWKFCPNCVGTIYKD